MLARVPIWALGADAALAQNVAIRPCCCPCPCSLLGDLLNTPDTEGTICGQGFGLSTRHLLALASFSYSVDSTLIVTCLLLVSPVVLTEKAPVTF